MINKLKIFFIRLTNERAFQHILFWCLSFLILMNILKVSAEIKRIDLIYTAIFHIPIVLVVYLNLRLLFPLFWEQKRYFIYAVSVVGLAALGSGFYLILFDSWIDYIFTGYYFIAYYSFWDISLYFAIYLFASSLFRLARGWFRAQELETERTLSELKALKSQINPHFLFNTLNNISSLAIKKSDDTPEMILKLSDILDYTIYECNVNRVPITKEWELIENYADLQALRHHDQMTIALNQNIDDAQTKVAPLILISLVENAFKYGLKGKRDGALIDISLNIEDGKLLFKTFNTKSAENIDRKKGIGLSNTKRQLALLYPDRYNIVIDEQETSYEVSLSIDLD